MQEMWNKGILMIISEKQIMQLMAVARNCLEVIPKNECPTLVQQICNLLIEIENQQSDELKVIK